MINNSQRDDWLIRRFERIGAVHQGHFVGKSGLHLDCYIDKDLVTSDPFFLNELALALVLLKDREWSNKVHLVVAPAAGALVFGGMLAHHLGCRFAFTVKNPNGDHVLRSGFSRLIKIGTNVLIAEDIVTSERL